MPYSDSSEALQAHVGNLASQSVSRRPTSWGKMSAVLQTSPSATTHWKRWMNLSTLAPPSPATSLWTPSSTLVRIGKASTAMARLATRVWDNSMLTTNSKMKVYQVCMHSTLLCGSETWTLYTRQERRLNTFHLRCLRRILDISWQDHVSNKEVLEQAGIQSVFAILSQKRLRWLGHVRRMQDGRIPKDILYGELATGSRPAGRPVLRYKDVCKRDMKTGNINPADWEAAAGDSPSRRASKQAS